MTTGPVPAERREEYEDILKLLLDHAAPGDKETEEVARYVAYSCLGENHLWQDMELPDRRALSELLERWFAPLTRMNTMDMKWKKFFYKKICEREGFYLCKSPSCGVCVDYHNCYGAAAPAA